tara:strand:+ start:1726 stop:2085 length:360 start_codon:yes stop_codon:yes gene_type:complete
MNSLSILIYLAGILGNVSTLLILIGVVILAIYCVKVVNTQFYNEEARIRSISLKTFPPAIKSTWVAIALFSVVALLPTKETLYLIAGSEAGEYVVNTPEAKEIMSDIQAIIKQQVVSYK